MSIYSLITRFVAEGDDATSVAETVARSYIAVGSAAAGATVALREIGQNAGTAAQAISQTSGALASVSSAATEAGETSEAIDGISASARAAAQSVAGMDSILKQIRPPAGIPGIPATPVATFSQPSIAPMADLIAPIADLIAPIAEATAHTRTLHAELANSATGMAQVGSAAGNAAAAAAQLSAQAPGINGIGSAAQVAANSVSSLSASTQAAVSSAVSLPPIFRQGAAAAQQLGNQSRSAFDNISNGARSALGSVTSLIGAYFGFQAVKSTIAGAVAAQFDYEDKVTGLAALINANFTLDPVRNFGASVEEAENTLARLAQRARVLPGDLGDMVGVAQSIAGPMFAAGSSIQELIDRSSQVPIVAGLIGNSIADTGQQLSRMMMGMSNANVPLAQALRGMGLLNRSFEELNALPTAERMGVIYSALDKVAADPDLLSRIVSSASAQFAQFRENIFGVTGLFGIVGATLRDSLVNHAREFNRLIERNQGLIRDIARGISGTLVPAIDTAAAGLRWAFENAQGIATALKVAAASYATIKAGSIAASIAAPIIQGGAAGGAASALSGGLLGSLAPNLIAFLRPAIADGALVAATAGGGIMAKIAGLGAGLQTLGALLAPIATVLVPVGAAIATIGATIAVAMDKTNMFGVYLTESVGYVGEAFGRLMNAIAPVGPAFLYIAGIVGSITAGALGLLIESLGRAVDAITGVITVVTGIVASIAAAFGAIVEASIQLARGNLMAASSIMRGVPQVMADAFAENWKSTYDRDGASGASSTADNAKESRNPTGVLPNPPQINIQNLNVTNNFDRTVSPERVAFGLIEQFRHLRATRPVLKPMQGY